MRRSQKERQPTCLDISVKVCCILYVTEKVPVQDSRVQLRVSRAAVPVLASSGSAVPVFVPAPPGVIVVFLTRLPVCVPAPPGVFEPERCPGPPR